jgi:hypothetical protein
MVVIVVASINVGTVSYSLGGEFVKLKRFAPLYVEEDVKGGI